MDKAIKSLKYIDRIVENIGYSIDQVTKAIHLLVLQISKDIHELSASVTTFKDTYNSKFLPTFDSVLFCLERIQAKFQYGRAEYSRKALTQDQLYEFVLEDTKLLNVTVESVIPFGRAACVKTCSRYAPDYWYASAKNIKTCEDVSAWIRNITASVITEKPTDSTYVDQIAAKMDDLIGCVQEYELSLDDASNKLNNIRRELDRVEIVTREFDYKYFQNNTTFNEIKHIEKNISWLETLKVQYSRFNVTKVKLSETITSWAFDRIGYTMDVLMDKLEVRVFGPLHTRADFVDSSIMWMLQESLTIMNKLAPYFKGSRMEDICRKLTFWQQPLANLDTPNILKFKFPPTETWRTWRRSLPLKDFLSDHCENISKDILKSYTGALHYDLHYIHGKFISAMYKVNSAFNALVKQMQEYEDVSTIDEDFIL